MDKLPKYATELVEWLDENVGPIDLNGMSHHAWGDMNPSMVRQLAYLAGQRSIVDFLVEYLEEDKRDADGDPDATAIFEVIRGPDGKLRKGAAPAYVARPPLGEGDGDADD